MPRLEVEAIADQSSAAAGNNQPAYVLVSSIRASGTHSTGLATADFSVTAKLVPAGASAVSVSDIHESSSDPGFFRLSIEPAVDWREGRYLLSVVVDDAGRRGQTLTRLEIV